MNQGSSEELYGLFSGSTVKSASSNSVWVPKNCKSFCCHGLSGDCLSSEWCEFRMCCTHIVCEVIMCSGHIVNANESLSAIWRRLEQIISKVKSTRSYSCSLSWSFPIRLYSLIIFRRYVSCSQWNEIFWIKFYGRNQFRKLLRLGQKRKKIKRRRMGGIAIFWERE